MLRRVKLSIAPNHTGYLQPLLLHLEVLSYRQAAFGFLKY